MKREYFWIYHEFQIGPYGSRRAAEKSCLFGTGKAVREAIEKGWMLERRTREIILEKVRYHV